jgi:hypothetical protein
MTTQNQKRPDHFDKPRKAPGGDQDQRTRDTRSRDREPAEESRFDKERQDRDRGTFERQHQGHGPSDVGDHSRRR